jgi:hypothetical protein
MIARLVAAKHREVAGHYGKLTTWLPAYHGAAFSQNSPAYVGLIALALSPCVSAELAAPVDVQQTDEFVQIAHGAR